MAEYRRGQGPNALPQGAATRLNARTPPAGAYQDMDIPVEFARANEPDVDEDDSRENEDMQVLLSPPDAGYRPPLVPRRGHVRKQVLRHLPDVLMASRLPDAPPALPAMYLAVMRRAEEEQGLV